MIKVDYISYLHNGQAVKFYPKTKLLLPINLPSHRTEAHLSGEWKVSSPKKSSPFKKYSQGKKNKMGFVKCKCQKCETITSKWIDGVCYPCYNAKITAPYLNQVLRERYDMKRVVASYQARKLVRLGDWLQKFLWQPYFLFRRFYFSVFLLMFGIKNKIKEIR